MTLDRLEPLLSSPKRLRLLAILKSSAWAEFAFLQESVDLAKADLSKQMKALTDAGFAESKRAGGRRGGTAWFRITKAGREAFDRHVDALRYLTEDVPVSNEGPA